MKLIEDATKLLDDCQRMEKLIYDTTSFYSSSNNSVVIQEQIEQVPAILNKCREMQYKLFQESLCMKTTFSSDLRFMMMRLEAAVMYAKKRAKLD
ncbi:MAG: hypothetical protein LBC02_02395 [Planctomycetaceae bacterium]|jgi:hypothetical protein|nr:hypothetical protein [Planctomycetaceae bacterium]